MALRIGYTYNIAGIGRVKIQRATAKGKKKKAVRISDGKVVQFGAQGYSTAAGKDKGQRYCSRSVNLSKRGFNANTLARADWNCSGKKSLPNYPSGVKRIGKNKR